jgi:hypothetical protein
MPQTITTQSGTSSITTHVPATNNTNYNPVLLATAPSTGCSRVIINRLTLKNTSGNYNIGSFNLSMVIGQDSSGYSVAGGLYNSGGVGMISIPQTSGDSNLGQSVGNAGSGVPTGGISYFFSSYDCSSYTMQNIPPFIINSATPQSSYNCTIPTQFWLTPSDTINLKLSVGGTTSPPVYEIAYSFIFITEVP